MSRWADDPERAADALIESCLDQMAPAGRIVLANQTGALRAWLAARGASAEVWNRRATGATPAAPWPPAGPFDLAFLRLPKSRAELEMSVHAMLGVLEAGARLIVYGGNDEGIRPAGQLLENLTGAAERVVTRGHGRVLATSRPRHLPGLRSRLADWRNVQRLAIAGSERDWVSYPGVFAAGRIDDGTALLLTVLPALHARARVLDFACGSGVVSAAALGAQPELAIDMLDNDSVALEAARENVPGARAVLGSGFAETRGQRYDAILSNPPLHQGIARTHGLLQRLIADAPAHLAPAGMLQLVVQRRIALDRELQQHFGKIGIVAQNDRYRVWRATPA
jgi:16S rRNA (guanine1207-N2)-methyltransferase